jgi:hypothetical protein
VDLPAELESERLSSEEKLQDAQPSLFRPHSTHRIDTCCPAGW